MSFRGAARELWDVAREVGRPTAVVVRASWREVARIMRRAIWPFVWERLVGLVITCFFFGMLLVVLKIASFFKK